MIRVFVILFSIVLSVPASAQREVRSWTNAAGKTIQATLVSSDGKTAVLRLESGRIAEVPLDSLSSNDQRHIAEMERLGLATKVGSMPEVTSIPTQVDVTGEDRVFETENFRFTTDQKVSVAFIAEAARIFEGTLEAVASLPFGLDPKPPEGLDKFEAQFVSREAFDRILREADDETDSPKPPTAPGLPSTTVAGVYIPQEKKIVVPYAAIGAFQRGSQMTLRKSADSSTLIHEITHQVIHDWLPIVPVWFTEGLSEYMATVPYFNGRFEFSKIDKGLAERMKSKYRGMNSPVKIPQALVEGATGNEWAGTIDSYREALALVYHLIHHRSAQPGQAVAAYLNVLDRAQIESLEFIENFNTAADDFEKKRVAFNEEVETYNAEVTRIQTLVDDYNAHVNAYNAGERSDLPVEPTFTDPSPPTEIELPAILKENGPGDQKIDIFAVVNQQGREALLQGQTLEAFAEEMAATFREKSLPIKVSSKPPSKPTDPLIDSLLKRTTPQ